MRVIRHGTSVSMVIFENPWHSHPMPSVWHRIFSVGSRSEGTPCHFAYVCLGSSFGKLLQNQLGRAYLSLFKLLWNFSMLGKLNHGLFRPIVFHMLYVNYLRWFCQIFSISGFILRLALCIFCAKIAIKDMTFPLITKSKIKRVSKKKNLKGIENDQMCPILVMHGTNYIVCKAEIRLMPNKVVEFWNRTKYSI